MCGIVGYVGKRQVVEVLLQGLKRLEYRGYDSAGFALQSNQTNPSNRLVDIVKSEGRIENVEKILHSSWTENQLKNTNCGMGHTRWATHGKPTTKNAHPHRAGHVILIHNGIIENYQILKKEILQRGHTPVSETDSELFGYLVFDEMEKGISLQDAVGRCFSRVSGQNSVVVMSEREPGKIVGVRNGSPLVIAQDPEGGVFLASDAQPIIPYTRNVVFLENGDLVICTQDTFEICEYETGKRVDRNAVYLDWSLEKLDKRGFPNFMLKEIHEQPNAIVDTLNYLTDRKGGVPFLFASQPAIELIEKAKRIQLVACGTSWHAALVGKYWIEELAQISTQVDLASEYRYRRPVLEPDSLIIAITQSGETADTLAVVRQAKEKGIPTLAITNVRGSSITREAHAVLYTSAGPEIGVAATKTFICQLLVLFLIAGYLTFENGNQKMAEDLFDELIQMPHFLSSLLSEDYGLIKPIRETCKNLVQSRGFFFIGRGCSFPIALEGALKLKEIAYIHAEGYAAGELKHGPIAMIDGGMAVVVLAPKDLWRDKTLSNLEEVKARGAKIIGIGNDNDGELKNPCDFWLPLPAGCHQMQPILFPFLLTPLVQLLSYELAQLKGTDVDKPRNLAKSVTVE